MRPVRTAWQTRPHRRSTAKSINALAETTVGWIKTETDQPQRALA